MPVSSQPRRDIDPISALLALETILQLGANLTQSNCYINNVSGPDGYPPIPTDRFIMIVADGGDFPEEFFVGGGEKQLTVKTGIVCKCGSVSRVDPSNQKNRQALIDANRGVLGLMASAVNALCGADPLVSNVAFVRELIRPIGFTMPAWDEAGQTRILVGDLSFELSYDWLVT